MTRDELLRDLVRRARALSAAVEGITFGPAQEEASREAADLLDGIRRLEALLGRSGMVPAPPPTATLDLRLLVSPDPVPILAGALFDFVGYLTTRPTGPLAGIESPVVLELLVAWAQERGLALKSPEIEAWRPIVQTWRVLAPSLGLAAAFPPPA